MITSNYFELASLSLLPRRRHAVVVGGSLAGMLAARVLSDHFDDVTLLERDRLSPTHTSRSGLPQGRHAHALLDRGRGVLEWYFPGLTADLVEAGAELLDATQDYAIMNPHGWYVRCPGGLRQIASSRNLLDLGVRSRVTALPNVRIRQGVEVAGLIRGPGEGAGIAGVQIRSRPSGLESYRDGAELAADLVVVADGRTSRLPDWLAALGYEAPQETVVDSFQGYASRYYRPPAGFKADWRSLYIQQAPPADPRGGLVVAVEGDLWLVSLVGGDGDYPPVDEAGFLDFARSLRSPLLYEAIAGAEPLTPIAGQRATENRLRHYDLLRSFPEGVVAVGDAVCAFNPVYGQGMTAAAVGAEVLDRWLSCESSQFGPGRGRAFQRSLARATRAAWQLSTGADYRFRSTEGPPQGRVARLTGRQIDRMMRAGTKLPWVRLRLAEMFHMLLPPSALFGPGVLARLAGEWLAGETRAGHRRVGPYREGTAGGLRPPRLSTIDLDLESAAGGRG
jgi:2-polyprenyl-6-methoxyphenol hydroxylase-like FAD-dependent oxidoreductase